ncbi:MAG: hypoxanthine phosphoribosyltransferase [Coriobacteriia bacterium]|nr:hypoxanthine phosphoribosyltransferase [Coriobacteriia bacterium]
MHPDITEILYTEDEIANAISSIGRQITADYADKRLLLVSILKGSFIFAADLIRHIELDLAVDFIAVASYGAETKSSGVVRIIKDLEGPLESYDILLVEDIVDSGLTLNYLRKYLRSLNPKSVEIAALLVKEVKQETPVECKYVGFVCPDAFVVGYGLDYAERYRYLPYIGVLDPKVYS